MSGIFSSIFGGTGLTASYDPAHRYIRLSGWKSGTADAVTYSQAASRVESEAEDQIDWDSSKREIEAQLWKVLGPSMKKHLKTHSIGRVQRSTMAEMKEDCQDDFNSASTVNASKIASEASGGGSWFW